MSQLATGSAVCSGTESALASDSSSGLQIVPPPAGLRLLERGTQAFTRILELTRSASHSIEVRAFLWRDDETGNELALELLRAADRGVQVHIRKDRIGANYELIGGSQQSFFHKQTGVGQGIRTWFLSTVYRGHGKARQQTNELAVALCEHPNVTIDQRKRFDHAKLFIFDEERIVLGSMGIGDNHRHEWTDVMVELHSPEVVQRLRERTDGAPFDAARDIDFLVHSRDVHGDIACPMLADRLALIDSARERLTVEMAYLGDRRYTEALLRAVGRGVEVTLVTSARADLLGDLNLATCDALLRAAPGAPNLHVFLHPNMIHSKVVVIDGHVCDVGSANFTRLSHGVYDEVNLYVRDKGLAARLEALVEQRRLEGYHAAPRVPYRKLRSQFERAFIAFFARNASAAGDPDLHDLRST